MPIGALWVSAPRQIQKMRKKAGLTLRLKHSEYLQDPCPKGSGFLGFRVLGFRVLAFRVLGFRVLGFRVWAFRV